MLCEFWKPLGLALLWKTASHYAWIAHTRLILLTSSVRVAHGQLCVLGPPFITHSISSTFYCCCDKLSQTHSVKEYKFIILHFCKLEVWNVSNSNKIKVSAGHIPFWRFWGRIYVSLYVVLLKAAAFFGSCSPSYIFKISRSNPSHVASSWPSLLSSSCHFKDPCDCTDNPG